MKRNSKKTIILVEDEPEQRDLMVELLSGSFKGYDVQSAESYRTGLQLIRKEASRIALFITDFNLGDGTGEQLLDELDKHSREVPRIVISGRVETSRRPGRAGRWLQKPCGWEEMLQAITQLL